MFRLRDRDDPREAVREAFAVARSLVEASCETAAGVYAALDRICRTAGSPVEATAAWAARGDRFACVFAAGSRYEPLVGTVLPALDPTSPLAAARRDGVCRLAEPPLRRIHPGDRAGLAIPLGLDAVFTLALREPPAATELERLLRVAGLAAPAVRAATERESDRARATYDGLTGLLSPGAFRAALGQRLRDAPRESVPARYALLFLDTDRFKEWNDTLGHAAGDRLLCDLAALLRAHAVGPHDLTARNGGDEFCLVWGRCEKSEAIVRAAALCRAVRELGAGRTPLHVSASIGIAAFPADALTAETLLERADAAMYASKRAGRDRMTYYETGGTMAVPG